MTTTPSPMAPSPDGWRDPRVVAPWAPRELLVAGLALSLVGAHGAVRLIAHAWGACSDVSTGSSFGLGAIYLPAIAVGMWFAFVLGAFVARSKRVFVRLLAGAVLAFVISLLVVIVMMPNAPHGSYPSVDRSEYPECGPDGIPTWWPSWLPS
jgi:hypothetical protein